MFSLLNPIRCRVTGLQRIANINNIKKITKRFINVEVDFDLETEDQLRKGNFDEYYDKLRLPFKMQRYRDNESKAYIRHLLDTYPNGHSPLSLEKFESLWEDIEDHQERKAMRNDINMIVVFYNGIINKSIFSPSTIEVEDMEKMMTLYKDHEARIRYVYYLFIREFDTWRRELEYQQRRTVRKEQEAKDIAEFQQVGIFNEDNELQYGFWRNSLFGRYHEKAKQRYSLHKLRQAEMFGQKFVVDCSFDESMADYETQSVARQISSIYIANRYSKDPFKLLFTGYNPKNRGIVYAGQSMRGTVHNPNVFFQFNTETYNELCPNEKLIYLSPDSRKLMKEFDHNATYIIGALVSKTLKSDMTFRKAREQGIECLRLPIHEYVCLKPRVKKVLSFQGVFKILLYLKHGKSWEEALRAGIQEHKLVPKEEEEEFRRKHYTPPEIDEENEPLSEDERGERRQ